VSTFKNDPARAGQDAGPRETLGAFGRYRVFPIHTRFDGIEWIVTDAETVDPLIPGAPAVIRQAKTREEAVRGLVDDRNDKLAQFGARVLEILESAPESWRAAIERADFGMNGIASRTIGAARSLGLLPEGEVRP
jgi:hypothetical protein